MKPVLFPGAIPVVAAALALALSARALAAAGLPRLGDLQAGPYSLVLYNDSPSLVTGRNLLTLEVPPEAADRGVQLEISGAGGQQRSVRLRRVSVVGGAESGHGNSHDSGHDTAAPDNVAPASTSHGATGAGHDGSGHQGLAAPSAEPSAAASETVEVPAGAPVLLRGKVDVPAAGAWTARVTITGPAGEIYSAETVLESVDGGPHRLYLLATGSLMAVALIFGIVARRRPATAATKGTR